MPWEDPEQYLKFSPISLVGNVSTPTMLLTGEADYRTPMSESENFTSRLNTGVLRQPLSGLLMPATVLLPGPVI